METQVAISGCSDSDSGVSFVFILSWVHNYFHAPTTQAITDS